MTSKIDRDQIARVARVYKRNQDASQALGISIQYFARLCRHYDVETPYARKRRQNHRAEL